MILIVPHLTVTSAYDAARSLTVEQVAKLLPENTSLAGH